MQDTEIYPVVTDEIRAESGRIYQVLQKECLFLSKM